MLVATRMRKISSRPIFHPNFQNATTTNAKQTRLRTLRHCAQRIGAHLRPPPIASAAGGCSAWLDLAPLLELLEKR